jgi:anti-sigma regulatory factor (Ser/Thr protein kinase)
MVGNHVYHAVEDHDGFLWFATETGVSRFDGTSFKNFTVEEGLPDNEILVLFVDSKNRVWMIPFNNEICFYSNGKIHNNKNDTVLSKMNFDDNIKIIHEDDQGNFYFVSPTRIYGLTKEGQFIINTHLGDTYFFAYCIGKSGNRQSQAFIAEDSLPTRLYDISTNQNKINLKLVSNSNIKFKGNKTAHSFIGTKFKVYTNRLTTSGTEKNFIVEFADPQKKNDTIPIPNGFNNISIVGDSIFYFNTNNGVFGYSLNSRKFYSRYLPQENITSALQDHENNLWFTSLENGIYRLYSEGCINVKLSSKRYAENSIVYMTTINNKVYAGNETGDIFTIDAIFPELKTTLIQSDSINNRLKKIVVFKNDLYFLKDKKILQYNLQQNRVEEIARNTFGFSFKDFDMLADESILLACHQFSLKLTRNGEMKSKVLNVRTTAISSTDSGYYAGSLQGLYFVKSLNNHIAIGDKFPSLAGRITFLQKYKNKLWVGTGNAGVICFDGSKIICQITQKEGLTGNLVRSLHIEDDIVWVCTDRGLSKIDISNSTGKVVQRYTINDGLISNMINCVAVYKDMLLVGTPLGLSIIQEDKISNNSSCKLQLLNIVSANSASYQTQSDIVFKPGDKNIRFEFVAISYKAEGDIRYYYKLNGLDKDWSITKENFLLYPSLPSGKYSLEIYAINKFGIRSSTLTIPFIIQERWFEKPWVIALLILTVIAISWLIISARVATIKKSQQAKTETAERMAMLEQQALKAQMNPHFIFNCLNSIQQYVIEKDVEGANRFITGFAALIRQTLDNSGKAFITVAEEESFLRTYLELEKSRFEDKFDYEITIAPEIRKDLVSMPPLLLQPYVENCIRHGIMHKKTGIGMVTIRFGVLEDYLVCEVIDNGIGREKAAEYKRNSFVTHQSKGTSLTGQRINLMNKKSQSDILLDISDIFDKDGNIAGTKVTVRVPLLPLD